MLESEQSKRYVNKPKPTTGSITSSIAGDCMIAIMEEIMIKLKASCRVKTIRL